MGYAADPSPEQLQQSLAFLAEQTERFRVVALAELKPAVPPEPKPAAPNEAKPPNQPPADPALQALTSFCQALISSNRFLYVD